MKQNEKSKLQKLLAMNVTELELRLSTMSALGIKNIHTIRDLVKTTEAQLIKMMGKRRTKELQLKLEQLGLTFDMSLSPELEPKVK